MRHLRLLFSIEKNYFFLKKNTHRTALNVHQSSFKRQCGAILSDRPLNETFCDVCVCVCVNYLTHCFADDAHISYRSLSQTFEMSIHLDWLVNCVYDLPLDGWMYVLYVVSCFVHPKKLMCFSSIP